MPLKVGAVVDKLINKFGFEWVKVGGRQPHERLAFKYHGKKVATTGFSRGFRANTDIDDSLLTPYAREVRVQTTQQFKGMIKCTVNQEAYLEILRGQGYIE
jgi:hypothetical protein